MRCSFLIFAILITLPHAVFAQQNFAVVDVQKLMVNSDAALDIKSQVEVRRLQLQDEFESYEQNLREKERELVEARSSVSQDEFQTMRSEFENDVIEMRKDANTQRQSLERAVLMASEELRSEIVKIVANFAEQRDYSAVLTKQNVVIVEKGYDISDEVMAILNDRIQTISLDFQ